MSAVIADSGPLMALAKLNLLHLLQQLYGQIYLSPAVYQECVTEGIRQGYQDAHTLKYFLELQAWSAATSIRMLPEVAALPLDLGERESIALAIELNGELLMDEERGRTLARSLGLKIRGTLGILIQVYRSDLITKEQLSFYLKQIAQRTDIWISPTLCQQLLVQVIGPSKL